MNKHKIKGFTFVELMVSMVIFSVLMLILFSVFYQTVQTWSISEGLVESQQNARIASDWMCMELHEGISYVDISSTVTTPGVTLGASTNSLVFSKPTSEFSYHDLAFQTITYSLQSNNLMRTVNNAGNVSSYIIASNIKNFVVSHFLNDTTHAYSFPTNVYDPKIFTISVFSQTTVLTTTTTKVEPGAENYVLVTQVGLRNRP